MSSSKIYNTVPRTLILLLAVLVFATACHSTRHLGPNQYLLRKTSLALHSDVKLAGRGEMRDNLVKMILQKPNSNFLGIPFKLWAYNRKYKKWSSRPQDSLPKSVERPALYDTAVSRRSVVNMKNYLYTQGFFYARINETMRVKHKKAYLTYTISTGKNYLINKVSYYIDDSAIAKLVHAHDDESLLLKGAQLRYGMLDDERSRVTALLRNNGYYKFTKENVNFTHGMDTVDKSYFRNAESPFEGIVNYTKESEKSNKQSTADLSEFIQLADDSDAFHKFTIASVHVYPDYKSPADLTDTGLKVMTVDGVAFRYHQFYVHPNVLYDHIYLTPGSLYSQEAYDKTGSKLTELGIFQYPKIVAYQRQPGADSLDIDILLTKSRKHSFSSSFEVSSGSTYFLGNSLSFNYLDKNLAKGANLLSIGVSGGVESSYNDNTGRTIPEHFSLLTEYYGANASIDFPKFLAPVASSLFDNSSLPHTIIGAGENFMDRVSYFTLLNTSANFTYSWHQSQTITWTLSPVFVNIIHLPTETDSFRKVLDSNAFLRNSYKENFIEGENISFTYNDINKKRNRNYSFIKLGLEEAGGLLGGLNQLGAALNDIYKIQYAQYTKLDFDARHYFTFEHQEIAMRFYGGVGIPYGQSGALPYIKQYFAGGPYSLRGWRIRTLGPGSYFDYLTSNVNQIDLTGDIKLEYNAEYRFPIVPLFADAVKMNGALFFDAGNIWLARPDPHFDGGNFELSTLGQDVAADMGAGTRFDIASFLTLRVDVAIPVKKPYIFSNAGWVFNQIDPASPTWRANNIIFNISIGYPF